METTKTQRRIKVTAAGMCALAAFSFALPPAQAGAKKVKAPGKATLKSVKVANYNEITAQWSAGKNANGYQVQYAKAKKTNGKWVKNGSWTTLKTGTKARSKKITNLKYETSYLVRVRALKSYKTDKKKTAYKYSTYSGNKRITTGKKNRVIKLVEYNRWKANNYSAYTPTVEQGESVKFKLITTAKGKFGNTVKSVSTKGNIKVTKGNNDIYTVTVKEDAEKGTAAITVKTDSAATSATAKVNIPVRIIYENLSLDNSKECSEEFKTELKQKIQKIVRTSERDDDYLKVLVFKKVSDMIGTYPYSKVNEKLGASCLIEAAKIMGLSRDCYFVQDGNPSDCLATGKLQDYTRCNYNVRPGVVYHGDTFKYRFDAQGHDEGEEQKLFSVWCYIDDVPSWFLEKDPRGPFEYMKKDGTTQHSYYDEIFGYSLAFSEGDYSYLRDHNQIDGLWGYWGIYSLVEGDNGPLQSEE